jgi:antitoxin MazE
MRKKLMAIGNSLGIIIDKPILELLDIDRDTELEIRTDGEALIIRPARAAKRRRVAKSADRMLEIHDDTLRKLSE